MLGDSRICLSERYSPEGWGLAAIVVKAAESRVEMETRKEVRWDEM